MDDSNFPLYPFFLFRFFPTGFRVLQTGPSLRRYPNFAHTGHLHAFLRRQNTTTTWFESDTGAGRGRSGAEFGGRLDNEDHRRFRLGDETTNENELSDIFPFLYLFHLPLPMVWTFLSIIQITGHLTTYPLSKEERLGSRVAKRAFFLFSVLKPLSFIKDGSGASGLLQTVEPCQRGMSTLGFLAFCVFVNVGCSSCNLG